VDPVGSVALGARSAGRPFSRADVRVAAGKGGVCIGDKKHLFFIRPAMEAFADEQPSLVLLPLDGALSMLWLAQRSRRRSCSCVSEAPKRSS
jgi:hypothetical protein